MPKMLGKAGHGNHCDCNIEQYVSGRGEKCNHRYGNKRSRKREKEQLRRELTQQQ